MCVCVCVCVCVEDTVACLLIVRDQNATVGGGDGGGGFVVFNDTIGGHKASAVIDQMNLE